MFELAAVRQRAARPRTVRAAGDTGSSQDLRIPRFPTQRCSAVYKHDLDDNLD